jgi:hypothetical protein
MFAALISANFCGAWASAKLPVVTLSKDGVSARAAFGEPLPKQAVRNASPAAKSANSKIVAKKAPAHQDILIPNKPSENLWAKSENRSENNVAPILKIPDYNAIEKTIRMPKASEFAKVEEDFVLPEESLFADQTLDYKSQSIGSDFFAGVRTAGVAPTKIKPLPRIASNDIAAKPVEPAPVRNAIAMQEHLPIAKNRVSVIENKRAPIKREITSPGNDDSVAIQSVVVPVDEPKYENDDQYLSARFAPYDDSEADVPLTKLSPMQLKRAFQKTYISENKHLSTYKIDDRFDVASDMVYEAQGFDSARDLSERGGVRPLEIRLGFRGNDSALSRDNFNLLSEYAGIVAGNPKRAIQVSIPERSTRSFEGRRMAARRLAIIEQVLQDSGVTGQRVIPVLSQRAEDSFVLRIISLDMFQTLSEKQRDMFGDTVSAKSQKSLSW